MLGYRCTYDGSTTTKVAVTTARPALGARCEGLQEVADCCCYIPVPTSQLDFSENEASARREAHEALQGILLLGRE